MTRDHARQQIADYLATRDQRRARARLTSRLILLGALVLTLIWAGALFVVARHMLGA